MLCAPARSQSDTNKSLYVSAGAFNFTVNFHFKHKQTARIRLELTRAIKRFTLNLELTPTVRRLIDGNLIFGTAFFDQDFFLSHGFDFHVGTCGSASIANTAWPCCTPNSFMQSQEIQLSLQWIRCSRNIAPGQSYSEPTIERCGSGAFSFVHLGHWRVLLTETRLFEASSSCCRPSVQHPNC